MFTAASVAVTAPWIISWSWARVMVIVSSAIAVGLRASVEISGDAVTREDRGGRGDPLRDPVGVSCRRARVNAASAGC